MALKAKNTVSDCRCAVWVKLELMLFLCFNLVIFWVNQIYKAMMYPCSSPGEACAPCVTPSSWVHGLWSWLFTQHEASWNRAIVFLFHFVLRRKHTFTRFGGYSLGQYRNIECLKCCLSPLGFKCSLSVLGKLCISHLLDMGREVFLCSSVSTRVWICMDVQKTKSSHYPYPNPEHEPLSLSRNIG